MLEQIKSIYFLDLPCEIKQHIFRNFIFDSSKYNYDKVLKQLLTYPFKTYGFKQCYVHRNHYFRGTGYITLISCDDLTPDNYNYNFLEEENTHRIGESNNVYPITWKYPFIIHRLFTSDLIINGEVVDRWTASFVV